MLRQLPTRASPRLTGLQHPSAVVCMGAGFTVCMCSIVILIVCSFFYDHTPGFVVAGAVTIAFSAVLVALLLIWMLGENNPCFRCGCCIDHQTKHPLASSDQSGYFYKQKEWCGRVFGFDLSPDQAPDAELDTV